MTIENFLQSMNTSTDSSDLLEAMRSIRDSGSRSYEGHMVFADDPDGDGAASWNPWT